MSEKYNQYIQEHKENVGKAFDWLSEKIPEIFDNDAFMGECEFQCKFAHDKSKYGAEEYNAYDAYFYGGNRSFEVVQNFNKAWLHHIHHNPHHWQHWVLINDDPKTGEIILDMPDLYIIEMICDWWSFSWKSGNLYEIFNWFVEHEEYMKLSNNTRRTVIDILAKIKRELDESDADEKN